MKKFFVTLSRIIKTGAVNFVRNAWLAIAAMAVMVVTLTVVLFSIIANVTFTHTIDQITSKIDVSVYLKDGISTEKRDNLLADLKKLPNVKSLTYLSKDKVLENYKKQNIDSPSCFRLCRKPTIHCRQQYRSSRATSIKFRILRIS